MPGPELMSPGSAHRTDLKSGVESDNTAPKKKKGMLGRIKSSLSTTFGLRKSTATDSPTQKALVSVEPEITDIAGNKQENDDEDEDNNDSKESQNNETDNEGSLDRTDSDEVLQFQEPLSVPELDSDVKSGSLEHEMKSEAASDEVKQHDSDSGDSKNANREQTGQGEGDGAAAEAEHEELLHSDGKKEAIPEQEIYEEKAGYKDVPEEEEDHLEVFDDGGGNQQLQESPRHEPEYDEHEDQGDESDMNSPSEPLMIIGTALQGPSAADAFSFEQNEIQDDGPETVVLPTVSEQPFSSPVKRARPGPMLGLAAIWSPRSPFSPRHNLPDGPLLQGVREEAAEESKQTGTTPRQFSGRRNVNDSMNQEAPILSSAFSQGVNHAENALEEQREENRNDEPDDNEDTPDADSFDAGAIISAAFGERIVNMLSADPWGDRQDGFDAVKRAVKKADVSTTDSMTRQRLLCATISAVQCGVEDKVAPVMYCSLDCLRAVLKEFSRVPNDQVCSDSGENSAAALNTQLSSLVVDEKFHRADNSKHYVA
ncbi:hypothetical protein PHYBOEH_010846 [Phytophthora boehmeriae]|uniref:Uncharacterized protein n=1 Tax=Phytophthora boehmeriae TaxID=109152 RepID=A0A8T1WWR5_9STRA|nr:hypothetical protein PHYBOEH_010846 [Phytophthora boehmeriae]